MLIVGDIIDRAPPKDDWTEVLSWLHQISEKVPIYASLGNHETICTNTKYLSKLLQQNGVTVLNDSCVKIDDLYLYGFTPWHKQPIVIPEHKETDNKTIFMCHSPSDYFNYGLNEYNYLITVSGHAHGGQWRLFGRGIFAPGQGLFPKYTNGFHDNKKLLITRGIGNRKIVKRFNNHSEIVVLSIHNPKGLGI